MKPTLHVLKVEGRVPYAAGLDWQRSLARSRIDGTRLEDLVLLLEHEPVVTLGRGALETHVLESTHRLNLSGIEVAEVERGGDVTYHGPGQLVGYPILDLRGYRKDLHWYLRSLEEVLIIALAELGLRAFRVAGRTGVWVGDMAGAAASSSSPGAPSSSARPRARLGAAAEPAGMVRKIASIGVHVSRWVTWHGFALNVTEESLRNFSFIVPCGIDDVRMTSLQTEGLSVAREDLHAALCLGLAQALGAHVVRSASVRVGDVPDLTCSLSV